MIIKKSDDRHYLHETVIRDIIDVCTDVKNSEELKGIFNRTSFRSVTKAASKLTMVFPVLIENDIPLDQAVMISKAIEKKAAAIMQMLFTAFCFDDARNGIEYIEKFHRNINFKDNSFGIDELIDGLDSFVRKNPEFIESVTKASKIGVEIISEDMKHINHYLPIYPEVETSVNDFLVDRRVNKNHPNYIQESTSREFTAKDLEAISKYHNTQVIKTNYEKANELQPTLMVVNFISTNDGATCKIPCTCVVGIKAKLYPISPEDVQERLVLKNKDKNGIFNFVRACTREISFWKDFVFAVDRMKKDALANNKYGSSSSAWKILERRAIKSKIKRSFGLNNDASAITTLVVSRNTVETLKKDYNLHIDKEAVLAPIMDAYNLMGIAIVDEVSESVNFLFDDGENRFETLTFSALEREKSDNNYKKIVNLMTKMSR